MKLILMLVSVILLILGIISLNITLAVSNAIKYNDRDESYEILKSLKFSNEREAQLFVNIMANITLVLISSGIVLLSASIMIK